MPILSGDQLSSDPKDAQDPRPRAMANNTLSPAEIAAMDRIVGAGDQSVTDKPATLSPADIAKMDKVVAAPPERIGTITNAAPPEPKRGPFGLPSILSPLDVAQGILKNGVPNVGDVASSVYNKLGEAASVPFRAAGQLDVNRPMPAIGPQIFGGRQKTPQEAEAAADQYGRIARDVALTRKLPVPKGVLGSAAAGGALSGGSTLLETGDPYKTAVATGLGAILGGALPAAGKAAGKVAGYTGINTREYQALATKKAGELVEWAKSQVPAWSKMPAGEAGLGAILTDGAARLETEYSKALRAVRRDIPESATVDIPAKVAKELGLTPQKSGPLGATAPRVAAPTTPVEAGVAEFVKEQRARFGIKAGEPNPPWLDKLVQGRQGAPAPTAPLSAPQNAPKPGMVRVPLGDAVRKGRTLVTEGTEEARQAMGNILNGVRGVSRKAAAELQRAQNAYGVGREFHQFAQEGKILERGRFNLVKAQEAAAKAKEATGKVVRETAGARGMKSTRDIVNQPGQITQENVPLWKRMMLGAKAGGLLGGAVGHPGIGVSGGAALGPAVIPSTVYRGGPLNTPRNIPPALRNSSQALLRELERRLGLDKTQGQGQP